MKKFFTTTFACVLGTLIAGMILIIDRRIFTNGLHRCISNKRYHNIHASKKHSFETYTFRLTQRTV